MYMLNVVIQSLGRHLNAFDAHFRAYHTVLDEIIKCHGNNTYDIPHCNKKKLEREKKLPLSMPLTADNEWTTTEEEAVEDDGSTWV